MFEEYFYQVGGEPYHPTNQTKEQLNRPTYKGMPKNVDKLY